MKRPIYSFLILTRLRTVQASRHLVQCLAGTLQERLCRRKGAVVVGLVRFSCSLGVLFGCLKRSVLL